MTEGWIVAKRGPYHHPYPTAPTPVRSMFCCINDIVWLLVPPDADPVLPEGAYDLMSWLTRALDVIGNHSTGQPLSCILDQALRVAEGWRLLKAQSVYL